MTVWAEFFSVGDRSVLIMDGRASTQWHTWAAAHARKYSFPSYQLMRGERFTTSRPIGPIVTIGDSAS